MPALEWDGESGPEEEMVIERLGFLLNAYTVQCYAWELVEMLRKLILTVALEALHQGDPAQLASSMLTIFIFLVLGQTGACLKCKWRDGLEKSFTRRCGFPRLIERPSPPLLLARFVLEG